MKVEHINPFSEKNPIIEVFTVNKADFSKPLEVKHAFRIWLYLHERLPPYPIAGIKVFINERWVLDKDYSVLITAEQFNELLADVGDLSHTDPEQAVQWLTEKWMGMNRYHRRGLE